MICLWQKQVNSQYQNTSRWNTSTRGGLCVDCECYTKMYASHITCRLRIRTLFNLVQHSPYECVLCTFVLEHI